ncbi:CPBP family glutamic-type intramembrane protease [Methanoculleus chikugoensis]|uniref:CPBP family intramembrane glutamic endopeptidase n=1 Tax=Methanoculleus chikugoensis TaxID=118126 RepID=UPI0006D08351|nr:CPBP family intramembrane glutamic endopeptidase [Methanoculleus chikugoensis]
MLTYAIMRLIGLPVPAGWNPPPLFSPLLFIAYFFAAVGEELGYTGYATDPMQARYTALTASIIIGLVHAVWHFPSMLSMGMSPGLFLWGGGVILAVSFRILTVWIYNNTGKSVFAAILFHAMTNTGRSIFPPGSRSAFQLYDGGYRLCSLLSRL